MDPLASLPDGFVWTGSLEETDIRSLYAACYSLRFSGRLELADGPQRAEVVFVAGEPVEIDGGDTQRIALWARGTFRAVQTIPSLEGDLTREREVAGSLGQTKPSALWAWVSEYRLTCEIDLERPGSKAVVTFQNGHAESAQVNGLPELAALARVSSWTDGSFRVRLRPLFIDAVIPCAPPMPDSAPPLDPRGFDVSRAIPMDLRNKPSSPFPGSIPSRPPPAPTPPLGELAMHDATRKSGSHAAPREERTALTQPLPPPRPQDFGSIDDVAILPRRKRSKAPWIVSLFAIVVAGGLGALYYFHLPPFSPPPRPIVEALPKPIPTPTPPVTKPDEKTAKADEKTAKADEKTAKADEKTAKPDEKTAKTDEKTAKTDEKSEPDEKTAKTDEKSAKTDEKSGKAEKPKVEKLTAREKAAREKAEKLIARGRALLAEGHEHTALDWFKRADHLWPKNPDLHIYEQQALGKLGRAELYLEGRGAVVIDGHRFSTPRKVRLAAGPHTVVNGDDSSELTLKRGEKKRLRVKR